MGHLTWAEEKGGIEELKKELSQETEKDKKFYLKPVEEKKQSAEEFLDIEWEKAKKVETEAEIKAKERAEINAKARAWEAKRQPCLSKFKKTLKEVGRFQAIHVGQGNLFVLDTKEGHFWIWSVFTGGHLGLIYGGQLCPGESMGEKVIYLPK